MAKRANYKTLLIEASELRKEGGISAYRRATILNAVFEDRNFRDDNDAFDDFQLAGILDDYVADLCVGFLELRGMLKAFPNQSEWESGKLAELYDNAIRQNTPERDGEPRTVKRVTKADVERVESERDDLKAQCRFLNQQQKGSSERIVELERENRKLREDNLRLQGRIEELERIVDRQTVGA